MGHKGYTREMGALKQLQHNNIVTMQAVCQRHTDDAVFLELEYCDGGSLRQWIAANQDPSPSIFVLKKVFRDVLRALLHVHSVPIVHLDVKPENILIDSGRDNRAVLCDFDVSRCSTGVTGTTTTRVVVVGTEPYIAPEMFKVSSHSAQPAADIFSLGVTLLEVLLPEVFGTHMLNKSIDVVKLVQTNQHALSEKLFTHLMDTSASTPSSECMSVVTAVAPPSTTEITTAQDLLIALLRGMLCGQPKARPTTQQILDDAFFVEVQVEKTLVPTSTPVCTHSDGDAKCVAYRIVHPGEVAVSNPSWENLQFNEHDAVPKIYSEGE